MRNPKELFVQMLSTAMRGTERSVQIYHDMSNMAQDPDIKEALEARAWIAQTDLTKLENCFKLLGEKPMEPNSRVQEIFVEDFRREVNAIESPAGKLMYILASASFLTHIRIAGYETMIALADRTGHHGVGVLLESCLADKIAFAERNRRFLRKFAESRVAERMAA